MSIRRQDTRGFWLRGDQAVEPQPERLPGQASRRPAWNNSTMVIQSIRDGLTELGIGAWPEPRTAIGLATKLERRASGHPAQ